MIDWKVIALVFISCKEANRKNIIIASAGEGTNSVSNIYENDIESIHFIEKRAAQKMKFSGKDFFIKCN